MSRHNLQASPMAASKEDRITLSPILATKSSTIIDTGNSLPKPRCPTFESTDYSSFKKLERDVKRVDCGLTKGFFDKEDLRKTPVWEGPLKYLPNQTSGRKVRKGAEEEDKENINKNVIVEEEVIKVDKRKQMMSKKPTTPVKKTAKEMEEAECSFQPKLSKQSMLIASTLGDPLERLTSKKRLSTKPNKPYDTEDLTFAPKINSRSAILDGIRRDKSASRFNDLHDQAHYLQSKKEKLRMENEMERCTKDEQECAFHPQLVTKYTPDHLNDMNFLERSYMWKRRVEQKLESRRKSREAHILAECTGRPSASLANNSLNSHSLSRINTEKENHSHMNISTQSKLNDVSQQSQTSTALQGKNTLARAGSQRRLLQNNISPDLLEFFNIDGGDLEKRISNKLMLN